MAMLAVSTCCMPKTFPTCFHTRRLGVSLNGEWRSIIDPYETGFYDYRHEQRDWNPNPSRSETFYLDVKPANPSERVEYDFDTSPTLNVPGDWNTQRPELYYYEGTVWYRKQFEFAGLVAGQRTFLRFGAVNYRADVYLDGKKLGVHALRLSRRSLSRSPSLIRPGTNSLVIKVDNKRAKEAVPTLNTDWWNYGGITRDVKLVVVPESFIADHRLALESETNRTISGWVQIDGAGAGKVVELEIPELDEKLSAQTDAAGRAAFHFTPAKLQLWSPETPRLYDVHVACGDDVISERMGFRTVRTQGKQILVNGQPVFLRGICIHGEFPLDGGGRVATPEQARQLLVWAKELGCNFIRLPIIHIVKP